MLQYKSSSKIFVVRRWSQWLVIIAPRAHTHIQPLLDFERAKGAARALALCFSWPRVCVCFCRFVKVLCLKMEGYHGNTPTFSLSVAHTQCFYPTYTHTVAHGTLAHPPIIYIIMNRIFGRVIVKIAGREV